MDHLNTGTLEEAYAIFQQPWWLDAVAPGKWGEARVMRGGKLAARLPFYLKRRLGFTVLSQPAFTHWLGPWLRPSEAKYTNQLSDQKELMEELVKQIPKFDLFQQNFRPEIQNWLPFYWAGFHATPKYTYRLGNIANLDAVWADLRENIRREARKAMKQVQIREDLDVEKFYELNVLTFRRQNKQPPYSLDRLIALDQACAARRARKIFYAEDAQGRIHAAVYIVWDSKCAYYLAGGANSELRTSGAASLLIWHAIKYASTVAASFDFQGSMLEPVERFFRAFGARQTPYYHVRSVSCRLQPFAAVHDWVKRFSTQPLRAAL